jgi:hypothetical protein
VLASVCTQIQISYAIVAATIPCLKPFMNALSTNYGAPAQTKASPSGSKSQYQNEYSLSSLSKGSRLGRLERLKVSAPTTPWDRANHQVSVVPGDQHSMESHESKKMIISKKNEWHVDYEGVDGPSQRSAEP